MIYRFHLHTPPLSLSLLPLSLVYRIDCDGVIKVADFGLTEDMYRTNYYRHDNSEGSKNERLPIRWMAPESIETNLYNESTDAVSRMISLCWKCSCIDNPVCWYSPCSASDSHYNIMF